jgi:hypothetical protein
LVASRAAMARPWRNGACSFLGADRGGPFGGACGQELRAGDRRPHFLLGHYLHSRVRTRGRRADDHAPAAGDPFERLTGLLKKEKAFPRKRKGLEGKVKSWFPQLSTEDQGLLVQRLFDDGFVSESEKSLTFASTRFRGV